MNEPIRLNLGAGRRPIDGWTNIDVHDGQLAYPLDAYADGSVDEIRASHLLEHYSHREASAVLAEWVRVLRPGGKLWVAVPDFETVGRAYLKGEKLPIQQYVMGGHVDEHDYHKCVFDEELLREAMVYVGLSDIERWDGNNDDCSTLPISLNLVGVKPNGPAADQRAIGRDVAAVMSMPRLAFTDNMFCAFEALAPLGIRLARSSGVFWGQCLTDMIEQAIADGFKYVLTIDYDTVFDARDVRELYRLIEARPEADAVCAIQQKRSSEHVLFTVQNAEGKAQTEIGYDEMAQPLIRVTTAHFGLTFLRCAAFAALRKPWFHSVPDQEGRWGKPAIVDGQPVGGKQDEDIAFWTNWRESGKTLYQANRVVIGHMQLMVTWPDEELRPYYQFAYDYNRAGRPKAGIWR